MNELTNLEINRPIIVSTFEKFGIKKATVCYDGFGDSGQIHELELEDKNGAPMDLETLPGGKIEYFDSEFRGENGRFWTDNVGTSGVFQNFIEHMVYAFLEDKAPGWEINEGSYGEITFFADGTVKMVHTVKIEETHEYEF